MDTCVREANGNELERKLREAEFRELLHQAQHKEPALAPFSEWSDVLTFLRCRISAPDSKAHTFAAILRTYQTTRDSRWSAILLAAYWLTLVAIHMRKTRWDADPDELWQSIVAAFFSSAHNCDSADPRVLENLYSDVLRRLRRLYRRQWRYELRHRLMTPQSLRVVAGGGPCAGLQEAEHCDALNFSKQRLQCWVCNRLLTPEQAAMLFFTRVAGAGLADYCRCCGLNFERARKQRQRIEAALERHGLSVL
jgi:hypothetical protein